MKKDRETPVDRFPLSWPIGWPETPRRLRARSPFRSHGSAMTMATATGRLMRELALLKAEQAVLSTNIELRLDGQPYSNRAEPQHPGAAVYFRHKGKPIVMACDKWTKVADNVTAIAQHIDAIRRMDRYGVGRLEQALAGYQRLLAGGRAWFDVLGFKEPPQSFQAVTTARNRLALSLHPDSGGSSGAMAELNAAYDTARQEFGK